MKQKDIILIVVVAVVSGVMSVVLSNILITPKKDRNQQAEVVEAITSDFPPPDTKYFNASSIDPTQLITIQNTNNTQPFTGTGN